MENFHGKVVYVNFPLFSVQIHTMGGILQVWTEKLSVLVSKHEFEAGPGWAELC